MLRLSAFCKSKQNWLIRYGYMGWDDKYYWSFRGPEDEWSVWIPDDEFSVWVPDIDWRSLVSNMEIPLKRKDNWQRD